MVVVDGDEVAAASWSSMGASLASMRSSLAWSSAKLTMTGFSSAAVRADGEEAGAARTQTGAGVAQVLAAEMEADRGAAAGVDAGGGDARATAPVAGATNSAGAYWICIQQQLV